MKRTLIIDTDENRVELLEEGYNIVEKTIYDEETNEELRKILERIVLTGK